MTSLDYTSSELSALLDKPGTSVTAILDLIAKTKADKHEERQAHRPLPTVPAVKAEDRRILRTVVDRVQAFVFPTEARVFTEVEKAEMIALFDDVKKALKVLTTFEETFKLAAHNHLDVELGDAARRLDQDESGHYVAAGTISAPDVSREIRRELRGGHAETLTLGNLQDLLAKGYLTDADFKAMTTPVPRQVIPASRVVSEAGVMNRIKANPKVLTALARVARLTPQTTAIAMRDHKVGG